MTVRQRQAVREHFSLRQYGFSSRSSRYTHVWIAMISIIARQLVSIETQQLQGGLIRVQALNAIPFRGIFDNSVVGT